MTTDLTGMAVLVRNSLSGSEASRRGKGKERTVDMVSSNSSLSLHRQGGSGVQIIDCTEESSHLEARERGFCV